jgi:hypothetical protein
LNGQNKIDEKELDKLFWEGKYNEVEQDYYILFLRNRNNPEICFKYGTSLLFEADSIQNLLKANNLLLYAASQDVAKAEYHFFCGRAYHARSVFDSALVQFQLYKTKKGKKTIELPVEKFISYCNNGNSMKKISSGSFTILQTEIHHNQIGLAYKLHNVKLDGEFSNYEKDLTKIDIKKGNKPVWNYPNYTTKYFTGYGEKDEGHKDIYIVEGSGDQKKITRLPDFINTNEDEDYPYFDFETNYLYFSSKGHNSMGGFDIYRVDYDTSTQTFGKVENLGIGISTPFDDFLFIYNSKINKALLTSGYLGKTNRYAIFNGNITVFDNLKMKKQEVIATFKNEINPTIKLTEIKVIDKNSQEVVGKFKFDETGKTVMNLAPGEYNYVLSIYGSQDDFKADISIPSTETQILQEITYEVDEKNYEKVLITANNSIQDEIIAENIKKNIENQEVETKSSENESKTVKQLDTSKEKAALEKLEMVGFNQNEVVDKVSENIIRIEIAQNDNEELMSNLNDVIVNNRNYYDEIQDEIDSIDRNIGEYSEIEKIEKLNYIKNLLAEQKEVLSQTLWMQELNDSLHLLISESNPEKKKFKEIQELGNAIQELTTQNRYQDAYEKIINEYEQIQSTKISSAYEKIYTDLHENELEQGNIEKNIISLSAEYLRLSEELKNVDLEIINASKKEKIQLETKRNEIQEKIKSNQKRTNSYQRNLQEIKTKATDLELKRNLISAVKKESFEESINHLDAKKKYFDTSDDNQAKISSIQEKIDESNNRLTSSEKEYLVVVETYQSKKNNFDENTSTLQIIELEEELTRNINKLISDQSANSENSGTNSAIYENYLQEKLQESQSRINALKENESNIAKNNSNEENEENSEVTQSNTVTKNQTTNPQNNSQNQNPNSSNSNEENEENSEETQSNTVAKNQTTNPQNNSQNQNSNSSNTSEENSEVTQSNTVTKNQTTNPQNNSKNQNSNSSNSTEQNEGNSEVTQSNTVAKNKTTNSQNNSQNQNSNSSNSIEENEENSEKTQSNTVAKNQTTNPQNNTQNQNANSSNSNEENEENSEETQSNTVTKNQTTNSQNNSQNQNANSSNSNEENEENSEGTKSNTVAKNQTTNSQNNSQNQNANSSNSIEENEENSEETQSNTIAKNQTTNSQNNSQNENSSSSNFNEENQGNSEVTQSNSIAKNQTTNTQNNSQNQNSSSANTNEENEDDSEETQSNTVAKNQTTNSQNNSQNQNSNSANTIEENEENSEVTQSNTIAKNQTANPQKNSQNQNSNSSNSNEENEENSKETQSNTVAKNQTTNPQNNSQNQNSSSANSNKENEDNSKVTQSNTIDKKQDEYIPRIQNDISEIKNEDLVNNSIEFSNAKASAEDELKKSFPTVNLESTQQLMFEKSKVENLITTSEKEIEFLNTEKKKEKKKKNIELIENSIKDKEQELLNLTNQRENIEEQIKKQKKDDVVLDINRNSASIDEQKSQEILASTEYKEYVKAIVSFEKEKENFNSISISLEKQQKRLNELVNIQVLSKDKRIGSIEIESLVKEIENSQKQLETTYNKLKELKKVVEKVENENQEISTKMRILASNRKEPLTKIEVIKDEIISSGGFQITSTNKETNTDNKPIPMNVKTPSGLVYRVQIGAFRKPIPTNVYSQFTPVSGELQSNGLTVYMAGYFNNSSNAINARKQIQTLGYSDAFIVAYCNGKKLTLGEARQLEALGECIPQGDNEFLVEISKNTKDAQSEQLASLNNESSTTVDTKSLFFTVQIGVYNKPINEKEKFPGLNEITSNVSPKKQLRYSTGKFSDINSAKTRKNEAVATGISDAFIVAYYQGERITIAQANELISKNESIVYAQNQQTNTANKIDSVKYISDGNKYFETEKKEVKIEKIKYEINTKFEELPNEKLAYFNQYSFFQFDKESGKLISTEFSQNIDLADELKLSGLVAEVKVNQTVDKKSDVKIKELTGDLMDMLLRTNWVSSIESSQEISLILNSNFSTSENYTNLLKNTFDLKIENYDKK